MRWLILQSDGEHRGQDGVTRNDFLRECHAIEYALRSLDQHAVMYGPRHTNWHSDLDFEEFDVVFIAENYGTGWLPSLSLFPRAVKIHWIVDLHYQPYNSYVKISDGCDIVLHATRDLINGYAKRVPKALHVWFPNAVDSRYFHRNYVEKLSKNIDFLFVGTDLPERRSWVNYMSKAIGMEHRFSLGMDTIDSIRSAKIHCNKNLSCDINYRTFETLGLGTCLLTNNNINLDCLGFVDGENCVLYNNNSEAEEKCRSIISSEKWHEIGENGSKLALRHTYIERFKKLLEILSNGYSGEISY